MDDFPFSYQTIAGTTWAYLSSLLMIALFFKFNRFWSVRNIDLVLIIMLVPGLLLIDGGRRWVANNATSNIVANVSAEVPLNGADKSTVVSPTQPNPSEPPAPSVNEAQQKPATIIPAERKQAKEKPFVDSVGYRWQRQGYYWLFGVGLLLLIRLIVDPSLTRRPLLPPNLNQGGLFFFAGSLMFFLAANVIMSSPTEEDLRGARNIIRMLQRESALPGDIDELRRRGPGYSLFYLLPILPMFEDGEEIMSTDPDEEVNVQRYIDAAKILAIVSQALIVLGLILFCKNNYGDVGVGVGTAAIYLMLPYTAMFTGHVMHTLPAALILWSFVCFRRPWLSGILIGLATGVTYYPVFLLPLWISFYWERGAKRFVAGVLIAMVICIVGLITTSVDWTVFLEQLRSMFGFMRPRMENLEGIWALGWSRWWRLPILVAFVGYCISFVAWPAEKNLGTLVAYTASVMVAVQFWLGFDGGLHVAWYLPLLLLIIFRPNLSGRVALTELRETEKPRQEKAEDLLPAS